jgi:flavoprotein
LDEVVKIYFNKIRKPINDVNTYIDKATENEYRKYDIEYSLVEPSMNYFLMEYLEKYQNEFIEII